MGELARNRKKPRARTWTLADLDRSREYRLFFDPESFRWEVVDQDGELVVTRMHLNRRSSYPGDRLPGPRGPRMAAGTGSPEGEVPAGAGEPGNGGRHRAEGTAQGNPGPPTTG